MSITDATMEYRRSQGLIGAYKRGLQMENSIKRLREKEERDKIAKRARYDAFLRRKAFRGSNASSSESRRSGDSAPGMNTAPSSINSDAAALPVGPRSSVNGT